MYIYTEAVLLFNHTLQQKMIYQHNSVVRLRIPKTSVHPPKSKVVQAVSRA